MVSQDKILSIISLLYVLMMDVCRYAVDLYEKIRWLLPSGCPLKCSLILFSSTGSDLVDVEVNLLSSLLELISG